jgi:hypothetical protein
MWEGDRFWIPLLLAKQHFVGREDFGMVNGVERMLRWRIGVLKEHKVPITGLVE